MNEEASKAVENGDNNIMNQISVMMDQKLANFSPKVVEEKTILSSVTEREREKAIESRKIQDIEKYAEENLSIKEFGNSLGDTYKNIYSEYENRKRALGGNEVVNNLIKKDFLEAFYNKSEQSNFNNMLATTKEKLSNFFKKDESEQINSIDNVYDLIKASLDYEADKKDRLFALNPKVHHESESLYSKFHTAHRWLGNNNN